MKTVFNLIVISFLFSPVSSARQEAPKFGFVRFVNAVVHGTGNVHFKVNGKDQYPKGYQLGQSTGGIGLPIGTTEVTLSREGVVEGSTSIDLSHGKTISLIGFAEKIPAGKDQPERWEMRILKLKQQEVEGSIRLTVLSVCQEPENRFSVVQEGRKEKTIHYVKRLTSTTLDLGAKPKDLEIYLENAKLPLLAFRPESHGNHVVILYDTPDGSVKAVAFQDSKFEIAG